MTGTLRVGVVVLDHGRPADAARAAASAWDPELAPRIVIVRNGLPAAAPAAIDRPSAELLPAERTQRAAPVAGVPAAEFLQLPQNFGFGGGMNAGVERLRDQGCDRFLLLNNDAVLERGCLRLLAEALDDPACAAAGPLVVTEDGARVESRGLRVALWSGRVRLEGNGQTPDERAGSVAVEALSGAVLMLSGSAVERIGLLDPGYFYGFEDVDWCLRARRAGFGLTLVEPARARHGGSRTLGRGSPDRIYYATRNHVRFVEIQKPLFGGAKALRRGAILALNLAFAWRQREVSRRAALRAIREGFRDARRGADGPRPKSDTPRPSGSSGCAEQSDGSRDGAP
jgi:GT2 family glycosyltransferase